MNSNDICSFQLQSCVWEITLACCFSCKYCGSKAGRARNNELTTEECINVAKQLAEMGCRNVSLIGGEVFMRADWPDIVKELTDRNVRVSIISNGFLFDERLIDKLKKVKTESVAISLDGPEIIHDKFRQKGSFQMAIRAIDVLTKHNVPVSVISTLHSLNVPYLEEMFRILKDKKIFALQLQACSPMGNASRGEISTDIDFREVIQFVENHVKDAPFPIGVADNIGYYSESEGCLRGNAGRKSYFRGCRAGLTAIGIDSVGNVRGCESMYDDVFIEGNLRERSLHDIWTAPEAFAYNRKFTPEQLQGMCKDCRYGSKCAGGCRSYNYFNTGELFRSVRCVYGIENKS